MYHLVVSDLLYESSAEPLEVNVELKPMKYSDEAEALILPSRGFPPLFNYSGFLAHVVISATLVTIHNVTF